MKVTIDRATWSAGLHCDGDSELLSGLVNGQRCCLGFLGAAGGIRDIHLENLALPSSLPDSFWPRELFRDAPHSRATGIPPAPWEIVFADLNDFENIDDDTRESWIAAGFRIVLGVEVEFVGEYPEVAS